MLHSFSEIIYLKEQKKMIWDAYKQTEDFHLS